MDIELRSIQQLLASVKSINKRYTEVQRVYEESGVRYNIFNVLGLSYSEVRLHSSILASLFGTKGHGAGDAFLKAFLRIPKLELPKDFMSAGPVRVETEKYMGLKTDDRGGRIDLYLSDGKDCLVIENKIYAGDQEHQLLRYHNEVPDAKLVYLTLDGKTPSDDSLGGLEPGKAVTLLSYQYDIMDWLCECVRIAANLPYVRETINQYIQTIHQLTNTDMPTNTEIINLISEKENIAAACAIRDNYYEALSRIMDRFIAAMKERLKQEGLPFTCLIKDRVKWTDRYSAFSFVHPAWRGFRFGAEFDAPELKRLYLGFVKNEDVDDIGQIEGLEDLARGMGYKRKTKTWYWEWANVPEPIPLDWNNAETLVALQDGRMVQRFIEILKKVPDYSKGANG